MNDSQNPRLAKWEIETIEGLAQESLQKASKRQWVEYPEAFTSRFITRLQTRCLNHAGERKALEAHAQRLLPAHQPPRITEMQTDAYDVGDQITASRWARLTPLLLKLPFDHDWRLLHEELVTRHVTQAAASGEPWRILHDGQGILEVLEQAALDAGLIHGEAPAINPETFVSGIVNAIGGNT